MSFMWGWGLEGELQRKREPENDTILPLAQKILQQEVFKVTCSPGNSGKSLGINGLKN